MGIKEEVTAMITDTKAKDARVQVPVPTVTGWVTAGKLLHLSEPPLLPL